MDKITYGQISDEMWEKMKGGEDKCANSKMESRVVTKENILKIQQKKDVYVF